MNILFLSNWFPYPADNGSKLRIFNLLRSLSQHHHITLISFSDQPQVLPPPQLKSICENIYVEKERPYNANSMRALLGLFSAKPRVLVDRYVPQLNLRIRQEVQSGKYDLVIASQWYMAAYYPVFASIPAIFEEVEVGIFGDKIAYARNMLQRFRHELTALKLQAYFRDLLSHFGACTVVSEAECSLLREMVPGYEPVEVIPNGVNLSDYSMVDEKPLPDTLVFTGSFRYAPNYDAMSWFLQEVYPRVAAEVPGVRLTITGDHANRSLPGSKNVVLTGLVKDVRPYVASAWASLVPIRSGGGTRLKVLEAMALRTPVIATSKGVEGLDLVPDEHFLLGDSPEAYADATIRLLRDPDLRSRIAKNAYQLVREQFDWPVIMPKFLRLADRVAGRAPEVALPAY